ncbi:MAG TPA: hypothetical protein VL978_18625 [Puia sp.]|nr:hypothetical protein [Puia sp.]
MAIPVLGRLYGGKSVLWIPLFAILQQPFRSVAQDTTGTRQDAAQYSLSTGSDITVPPGATVAISILFADNKANLLPVVAPVPGTWTVDGQPIDHQDEAEGMLKVDLSQHGTYTAPKSAPAHNPVVITATIDASGNGLDQSRSKAKIVLICRVTIMAYANFFYVDGTLFKIKEPLLMSQQKLFERAIQMNGQWNVMISGKDSMNPANRIGINLSFVDDVPGTYPWFITWTKQTGVKPPGCSVVVTCQNPMLQYASFDCVAHGDPECKGVTLSGTTTISQSDPFTRSIQGYFYGQLVGVSGEYHSVSGAFIAHY